ncbi:restriction endonuclease subunit S, partial [Vibrio harveyi]|nr:restriction endonuclease subunit S [Vibrio harveyi]
NCYYEKFKDGRVEKIDNELNNQKSLDYKRLHEVVYFDKKFKGVEKDKQRKILKFHHISSNKMKSIDIEKNGIVRLLSTGKLDGYCNISTEKEIVNFGEVISIPTGGSAILKYHHGFFIDSLNILFSSQDPEIYYLKYIYYALLNKVEYIQQCFKGSSIQHPDMKKIIDITIPIPNIEEQKHIVKIIDSLEPFIQKYEKLQNELEILNNNFPTNLEKSIINYAMQGKLVKQDEKDNSVDKLINEIYKEKEKLVKEGKLKNTELKDLIIYKNSDDNSYYE